MANTLQTRGARGRAWWVRFTDDYPRKTVKLRHASIESDLGEYRAGDNTQQIVWGIHPDTQKPYRFVVKKRVMEIEFQSINWPEIVRNAPITNATDGGRMSCFCSLSVASVCSLSVVGIDDAVRSSIPIGPHQSDQCLFKLARLLLAVGIERGSPLTHQEHYSAFDLWYRIAHERGLLRTDETRDEYFEKFMNKIHFAKKPLGSVLDFKQLLEEVDNRPLPPEATMFCSGERRRLVGLCAVLQKQAGDEPFFLSCRKAAGELGFPDHTSANRAIRCMVQAGVLVEVSKGSGLKASRYRFVTQDAVQT